MERGVFQGVSFFLGRERIIFFGEEFCGRGRDRGCFFGLGCFWRRVFSLGGEVFSSWRGCFPFREEIFFGEREACFGVFFGRVCFFLEGARFGGDVFLEEVVFCFFWSFFFLGGVFFFFKKKKGDSIHCDVGKAHSWICDCWGDVSGRQDKAQTA